MLAVLAASAVTLAALKQATEFWLGVAAAVAAQGLLFATVRAVTGPGRPFWASSAVSGGLYLEAADGSARRIGARLIGVEMGSDGFFGAADLGGSTSQTGTASTRAISFSDDREVFDRIGHLLEALALALIGGLAGHGVGSLARRRRGFR
jgi:hypothetical protein